MWCQDNEDEDGGEELSFNESQGVARTNMVKTARRASKEVEIEVRTMCVFRNMRTSACVLACVLGCC